MNHSLPSIANNSKCKICGGSAPLFDVIDFGKFCSSKNPYRFGLTGVPIYYLRCIQCEFIFTEYFDAWTPEQFQLHIYNDHYEKVDPEYLGPRAERMASMVIENLCACPKDIAILDYGSGSGVFSENLASAGFTNIKSYDPYSNPIRPDQEFDVITCFEVLEHSPDPNKLLGDILSFLKPDGIILFSTCTQPIQILQERAGWWYIAPRNGHVSIFSKEALTFMAKEHSLYYFEGKLQCFSRDPSIPSVFAAFGLSRLHIYTADSGTGNPESWHGIEKAPSNFLGYRWSSSSILEWIMPFPRSNTYNLKFKLPYIMEIRPDFASQSYLEVNSHRVKMRVVSGETPYLEGTIQCPNQSEPVIVRVITETPISPAEQGWNPDTRRLGLAVPTDARQWNMARANA